MTDGLALLEKKTYQIEKEIISLRYAIQRLRKKKILLSHLIDSLEKHNKSREDTTNLLLKMRKREIKW